MGNSPIGAISMDAMQIGPVQVGKDGPLLLIAGPCVIESEELVLKVAAFLKDVSIKLGTPIVFKASFDKANRTSLHSFRGPGLEQGLEILQKVKREVGLPVLSDVHEPGQMEQASAVLDAIQIPAFLCRQTDLLVAAGRTGLPVNVKKGQFLSPWEMGQAVEKIRSTGNHRILLTERGTFFGYNNLVVDMRSIVILRRLGCPVIFDATHSVQLPGRDGTASGGQREFVGDLANAAVAAGADGVFLEVHPDPDRALCDGANSLPLSHLKPILATLMDIHHVARTKARP
jgi:2-dehydro-3-deoxyphosphooctonate aldolase (KDO 8-P synthase)